MARAPGAAWPSAARPRARCPRSTATRHIWSMWPSRKQEVGLAVVGAERAVLGPVLAHQRQQRRAGCARWRPRGSAPTCPRRRFSSASSSVVASWSERMPAADVGVQRAARARPARGRRRAWRRATRACASTSGSPAMTPGKFIISATPSARGWRRIASMSPGVERPAAATRSRSPARTTAPSRRRRAAGPRTRRAASATPSAPSTLAISCGSHDDRRRAVRDARARANSAGVSLRRLDVHVRVDEARARGSGRAASIRSPPS